MSGGAYGAGPYGDSIYGMGFTLFGGTLVAGVSLPPAHASATRALGGTVWAQFSLDGEFYVASVREFGGVLAVPTTLHQPVLRRTRGFRSELTLGFGVNDHGFRNATVTLTGDIVVGTIIPEPVLRNLVLHFGATLPVEMSVKADEWYNPVYRFGGDVGVSFNLSDDEWYNPVNRLSGVFATHYRAEADTIYNPVNNFGGVVAPQFGAGGNIQLTLLFAGGFATSYGISGREYIGYFWNFPTGHTLDWEEQQIQGSIWVPITDPASPNWRQ